jgi:hypothetical protein
VANGAVMNETGVNRTSPIFLIWVEKPGDEQKGTNCAESYRTENLLLRVKNPGRMYQNVQVMRVLK